MAAPRARERDRDRAGPTTLLGLPTRRRRGRLEWQLLRWQARLDTAWADRVVPAATAVLLFVVWTVMAFTRFDRLDAGETMARNLQGIWHLSSNHAPSVTIGVGGNLFADRLPILMAPVGLLARVVPAVPLLLTIQSASLALGAFPVWRIARRVANLGVGSAAALLLAYALHPAVADLDLADFNPATMALTPLLAAAYFAERRRWGWFALASTVTVLWSSELAIVIATLGAVLLLDRQGRPARRTVVLGLAWVTIALLFIQVPLGTTGLVGPGAFHAYGSNGLDVIIEMVRNPFHPLGDVLARQNLELVVWTLGPLVFLPVLAVRKLVPALPITALYFVADVDVTGPRGGGRMVPLVAFSFVAAAVALSRLGRLRIDRMLVDRRLLGLLAAAAVAGAALTSPLSPYERPWRTVNPDERDDRVALARIPSHVAVRVPEALAPRVAERDSVFVLEDEFPADPGGNRPFPPPAELVDGVRGLVIDTRLWGLDDDAADRLRNALAVYGFLQVRRAGNLRIYLPYTDPDDAAPAVEDPQLSG